MFITYKLSTLTARK